MSPGKFLFVTGSVYFVGSVLNIFWLKLVPNDWLTTAWCSVLSLRLLWIWRKNR